MIPTIPADQHATRFFNALDKAEAEARADASIGPVFAADAGAWAVHHTGGGCLTWAMPTDDGAAELWICDEGNGLGVGAEFWLVGLHPHEGWEDHWQAEAKTLQEALALAHAANAARQFALFFRPDAPMTLREFVASKVYCPDFSKSPFHGDEEGAGWVYNGGPYINQSADGSYSLIIERSEWNSADISELEPILYRWASGEGYLTPRDAPAKAEAPAPAWSDDFASQPDAVARLAAAFRDVLQEWIGTVGMAKVRRENVALAGTGSCASHNYCDANMAMEEATRRTFGAGPLDSLDHMTDAATALWNAAWDKAKADYLTDATQ